MSPANKLDLAFGFLVIFCLAFYVLIELCSKRFPPAKP